MSVECVKRRVQRKIVVDVSLKVAGFPEIAGDDEANRTKRNVAFIPEDVLATLVSHDDGEIWMAQVKVYGDIDALVRGYAAWTRSLDKLPEWLADVLRSRLNQADITASSVRNREQDRGGAI